MQPIVFFTNDRLTDMQSTFFFANKGSYKIKKDIVRRYVQNEIAGGLFFHRFCDSLKNRMKWIGNEMKWIAILYKKMPSLFYITKTKCTPTCSCPYRRIPQIARAPSPLPKPMNLIWIGSAKKKPCCLLANFCQTLLFPLYASSSCLWMSRPPSISVWFRFHHWNPTQIQIRIILYSRKTLW